MSLPLLRPRTPSSAKLPMCTPRRNKDVMMVLLMRLKAVTRYCFAIRSFLPLLVVSERRPGRHGANPSRLLCMPPPRERQGLRLDMNRSLCPGGKEDSQGTAWRPKRPGNHYQNGHEQGPESVHVIAAQSPRCRRARHVEEGASIRPFLEPRETRHQQGDDPKQLAPSQDGEQVHRVAEICHDLDDGLADEQ